mgnify:CR=1 FL=1
MKTGIRYEDLKNNIEKMFIANEKYMAIWYQNEIKSNKNANKIDEISGTFKEGYIY